MEKTEKFIFTLGICSLAAIVILLIIFSLFKLEFVSRIIAVIIASAIGGRMVAILAGFELELHSTYIILILSIFNTVWLFVMLPLIITFYHKIIELRFLGKMLHSTKRIAQIQKDNILRFGIWGLPVFIWLPFPWTGALVGSVIGFLLGFPTKKNIIITVISMLVGVISWTIGFKYMLYFTGPAGKIISILVLAFILFTSVLKKSEIHYGG